MCAHNDNVGCAALVLCAPSLAVRCCQCVASYGFAVAGLRRIHGEQNLRPCAGSSSPDERKDDDIEAAVAAEAEEGAEEGAEGED